MNTQQVTPNEIQALLSKECRRHVVRFWGKRHFVTPRLVEWIHGDGRQVIYLTPIMTRPNYYVARIDSRIDLNNWVEGCFSQVVLDDLYDAIEEQFGPALRVWTGKNGREYEKHDPFPALNYEGCSWGLIAMIAPPAASTSDATTTDVAARKDKE